MQPTASIYTFPAAFVSGSLRDSALDPRVACEGCVSGHCGGIEEC